MSRRIVDYVIASVLLLAFALVFNACESEPVSTQTKNRVPAMPAPAAAVDPPAPTQPPAPPKPKDRPMYGETFFLGTITSVYYYPNGGNQDGTPDNAATHVKFDYRDDDIWLCGDQRPKLTPGERAKMVVTFEPNTECETNWRLK